MKECHKRVRINGNGCKYFVDGGYCSSCYWRCFEWMKDQESQFTISHSQYKIFDRCPLSFMFNQILGLEPKPQYQSLALRRGLEFQRVLSNTDEKPAYFSDEEQIQLHYISLLINYIRREKLLPENLEWEVRKQNGNVVGTMDFCYEKVIGELKYTESPDWYFNKFIAFDQLETYFHINASAEVAYMLPVRVPQLRLKKQKDETKEKLADRVGDDIWKRPAFYFPGLNRREKGNVPKWGRVYTRLECDLDDVQKKIDWTIKEIRDCCKAGYFPYRRNCLSPGRCDYMNICQTKTVNDELYERKSRDDLRNEIK